MTGSLLRRRATRLIALLAVVLLAFVIPFGFMNYFPASYFLHKADNGLGLPLAIGVLTPAVGVVFLVVAYAFWRFGLQRYQGVGH